MKVVNHAGPRPLALETTVLVHGVPLAEASALADELRSLARNNGASPAFVGVFKGVPTVGLTDEAVSELIASAGKDVGVAKANAANLGILLHRGAHAATTVSATMELAAAAGIRVGRWKDGRIPMHANTTILRRPAQEYVRLFLG